MAVKKKSFEESMKRLEEIVSQLERGESSLDQSLKLFEEGTGLAAHCTQMLDQAEQKVHLLLGGEAQEEVPFQEGEQNDGL
ncbi:MAG TPA: exodeoxyribonuclease VII small subunit [Candidatus Enterenecus faecium]|uniref:Exodeoxyribonuclease 7 small subunit n=1 Tax=Candidatus Enterenecus faecium TaxID=2840780 RepID=A0A9D0YSV7_9FIRM|nr:exodeoxyribonuclease VII small subunit [Candidatus Enterenecus faecium]